MKVTTKRILALMLCAVMVFGLMPVSAFAEETVIDAAIFCSDVHGSTSDLTSVLAGVKTSGVDYSSIGFVGDTCLTVANTTSIVQSALGDTDISVMFSYAASHDTENSADIGTNWNYSGEVEGVSDNYLVYTIRETDMQNNNGAEAAFSTWYSGLTADEKALPIFIMSHRPLHARRNDNAGAAAWYDAISAAAESSDIVFFWAHNHTSETSVDTDAYYVAKDGDETFTVYNGDTVTPNFTYMNAGYINANNQNPARKGVATTVQITADSLIFQDYNSSGEYSGTYAHNVTVAREFASSTDSGEDGSTEETTSPTEGETTTEEKEVYVLVDTMTVGEDYLIANGNSGTVTLLGQSSGSAATTTAEVKTSGDYTYIETADSGYIWNATAHTNSSYSSYPRLINAETYAMYVSSKSLAFSSSLTSTSGAVYTRYWTYTDGQLACVSTNSGSTTYYLTYSDGYSMTSTATDGIYIYEKQTIEVNSDGSVSGGDSGEDDTTGGSTETVVGNGTYTTADDGSYQKVTFETTVTGTETKTVYVLSSGNPSGNVLIANSAAAGSVNLVANDGGDLSNTSATVVYGDCDGDGDSEYYIELTDTEATNSLWAVSGSYTFENQDEYLRYNNGNLSVSGSSTTWSYSSNRLSYKGSSMNSKTYYLRYNSGWSVTDKSNSASSIYFYVPTEVEVETTETTTKTYSVSASNIEHFYTADTTDTETVAITASVTDGTPDGSYAYEVVGGDNIITSISEDGVITFNGTEGTAQVKVSYTWTDGENTYTIWQVIDVTATSPYYTLDLRQNNDGVLGDEITETIAIKGVEAGDTYSVWAVIKYYDGTTEDGTDLEDVEDSMIEWTSSDPTVATVDPATGVITFTGKDGTVNITATYLDGNRPSDTITISATTSQYSVPSDGTNDFPEYPDEGAIRYDKTAVAVGNFSETGIAQVELSMTGVPYTTGSEIDVVLMLDITGSMHDVTISSYTYSKYARVEYTILASQAFVESIVVNEDGSYNGNRVGVYSFNSNGTFTLFDLGTISSDAELTAAKAAIATLNDDYASGGTPYDDGLSKVQSVLSTAKTDGTGNNRQQFAVFMTDGVPTDYEYITGSTHANYSSASSIAGMLTSSDNYCTRDTDYYYEYYSTEMKGDGITVYSVGIGLENTNSAWSGTAAQCLNLASRLLNDISGPANETTQPDAVGTSTLSKQDKYFFSVADSDAATEMENVFQNIAVQILQAATDITVEDQITDEYTMIFDIPTDTNYNHTISTTQEFYIEFLKYTLDENHERTDSGTSVTKLYLGVSNGTYYAASDSTGTAYDAPVFEQKVIGEKGTLYYWTTDSNYASKAAVSYNDGTNTYYFIPYGMEANADGSAPTGWYNMTSGAYANGTIDSTTNMSTDLVIATPYFVYNASTKMLYWTVDKLDTEEYALTYFLYLDDSATDVGETTEVDAATYPTNDHAYITYTNFRGNDCRQEFPIPQLTWNGAQVSYVFYLVNAAGQPINKSGQVVDFANAVFVTDVYTKAVVWNKSGDTTTGTGELSADWLAAELLSDEYTIYDELAGFELNVYEKADGTTIKNQFTIEGDTAANISTSLNTRLELETTASTVSEVTTKIYNTKAGQKVTGYGTYYSTDTNMAGIDFSNVTVAFAVVWESKLVEDVVVVDFGLDVLINVVQNDLLQNTISGIGVGNSAYGDIKMNTGVIATSQLGTASLNIDGNTISIENENQVRFHQGDMEFAEPVEFYYESPVKFYEDSEQKTGYMYSSVTVIPATTIYYEDDFVTLKSYNMDGTEQSPSAWENPDDGNAVQAQDRPGTSQISAAIDADNNYGYDDAYIGMSEYSMDSAAKITVDENTYGTAQFSFYGTGFDVISLTSYATGNIVVNVAGGPDSISEYYFVDTFYGYARGDLLCNTYTYTGSEWKLISSEKVENPENVEISQIGDPILPEAPEEGKTVTAYEYEWIVVDSNNPNALYQVPVMKVEDLAYGKYTVTITASYVADYDHVGDSSSYDFYLDAIRIYDPANDGASNATIKDAYIKDGEYLPEYYELRNWLISRKTFDSIGSTTDSVEGIVFIDGAISDGTSTGAGPTASVTDYSNFGPNNELYLAPGQAVAFDLNAGNELPTTPTAPEGYEYAVKSVQIALKSVGGTAAVKLWDAQTDTVDDASVKTISTATDLYYDITELDNTTVVIMNAGSAAEANAEDETVDDSDATAILSITNVKVTYKLVEKAEDTETDTDPQSVQGELQTASLRTIGAVQTYAVAATAETESENAADETTASAPFTVRVESVEKAIASMTEEEENVPEETEPETTEPEETKPETTEPEETEHEVTEPEATEPEETEPETTEPEETEPEDSTGNGSAWDLIDYIIRLLGKIFG